MQTRSRILLAVVVLSLGQDAAAQVSAIHEPKMFLVVVDGLSMIMDSDGNTVRRFKHGGIAVTAAQIVDKNRVLLAVYSGERTFVGEHDLTGKGRWSRAAPRNNPRVVAVQLVDKDRLLVAESHHILMVDRRGGETPIYERKRVDGFPIMDAQRLPDGKIAILTTDAFYRLLDEKGTELKSFRIGRQSEFTGPGRLTVLPNGAVLISKWNGTVSKYDQAGKSIWDADVRTPVGLVPLPNEHCLVGSMKDKCLVELNRNGKEVNRIKVSGEVTFVSQ